jgi:hypothetical protein
MGLAAFVKLKLGKYVKEIYNKARQQFPKITGIQHLNSIVLMQEGSITKYG